MYEATELVIAFAKNVNIIMAMVLVTIFCGLALALVSPQIMRWVCARGLGWAAAVEVFTPNRIEVTGLWEKKLAERPATAQS